MPCQMGVLSLGHPVYARFLRIYRIKLGVTQSLILGKVDDYKP